MRGAAGDEGLPSNIPPSKWNSKLSKPRPRVPGTEMPRLQRYNPLRFKPCVSCRKMAQGGILCRAQRMHDSSDFDTPDEPWVKPPLFDLRYKSCLHCRCPVGKGVVRCTDCYRSCHDECALMAPWQSLGKGRVCSRCATGLPVAERLCRVCEMLLPQDQENSMTVVCDVCDDAYHVFHLPTPLEEVPEGDSWFCPQCSKGPGLDLRAAAEAAGLKAGPKVVARARVAPKTSPMKRAAAVRGGGKKKAATADNWSGRSSSGGESTSDGPSDEESNEDDDEEKREDTEVVVPETATRPAQASSAAAKRASAAVARGSTARKKRPPPSKAGGRGGGVAGSFSKRPRREISGSEGEALVDVHQLQKQQQQQQRRLREEAKKLGVPFCPPAWSPGGRIISTSSEGSDEEDVVSVGGEHENGRLEKGGAVRGRRSVSGSKPKPDTVKTLAEDSQPSSRQFAGLTCGGARVAALAATSLDQAFWEAVHLLRAESLVEEAAGEAAARGRSDEAHAELCRLARVASRAADTAFAREYETAKDVPPALAAARRDLKEWRLQWWLQAPKRDAALRATEDGPRRAARLSGNMAEEAALRMSLAAEERALQSRLRGLAAWGLAQARAAAERACMLRPAFPTALELRKGQSLVHGRGAAGPSAGPPGDAIAAAAERTFVKLAGALGAGFLAHLEGGSGGGGEEGDGLRCCAEQAVYAAREVLGGKYRAACCSMSGNGSSSGNGQTNQMHGNYCLRLAVACALAEAGRGAKVAAMVVDSVGLAGEEAALQLKAALCEGSTETHLSILTLYPDGSGAIESGGGNGCRSSLGSTGAISGSSSGSSVDRGAAGGSPGRLIPGHPLVLRQRAGAGKGSETVAAITQFGVAARAHMLAARHIPDLVLVLAGPAVCHRATELQAVAEAAAAAAAGFCGTVLLAEAVPLNCAEVLRRLWPADAVVPADEDEAYASMESGSGGANGSILGRWAVPPHPGLCHLLDSSCTYGEKPEVFAGLSGASAKTSAKAVAAMEADEA